MKTSYDGFRVSPTASFRASERDVPKPVSDVLVWMIAVLPGMAAVVNGAGGLLGNGMDGVLASAILAGLDIAIVVADVFMVKAAGLEGPGVLWGVVFDPVYVHRRRVLSGRNQIPFYLSLLALALALVGSAYGVYDESRHLMSSIQSLDSIGLDK